MNLEQVKAKQDEYIEWLEDIVERYGVFLMNDIKMPEQNIIDYAQAGRKLREELIELKK